MTDQKLDQSFRNLRKALDRLREAVLISDPNELIVDATIKRFEFTFELFWKTLKIILENEGLLVASPRESIRKSYQAGWLENEQAWLEMLRDRNLTSHVYDETTARQIYERITKNFSELDRAYQFLAGRFA